MNLKSVARFALGVFLFLTGVMAVSNIKIIGMIVVAGVAALVGGVGYLVLAFKGD
jgi:hypothetical protein